MTEPLDRLSKVKEALDEARLRRARGELSAAEYRELLQDLTIGLSAEQRAELGLTPTPTAHLGQPGSGVKLGPSGGRTEPPRLSDLMLEPGTVLFDQWKITHELGRGGFGAVFGAEELHLHKLQAIKILDPAMAARDELLARFRREVEVMRELVHPRIVRVYDYREDPQQHLALFSMELIQGCSVRDLLQTAKKAKQPIPVAFALSILQQTLEALVQAHAQGVIHRDVTPGNILLAGGTSEQLLEGGCDPQVKLVDFGIAGLVEKSELSQRSRVLGTAAYVAPEVLDESTEITPAADVYGAGAVAYEMLTGRTPLVTGYEPTRHLRADLGEGASALVMECVLARPERRVGAAAALARLAPLLQEAIGAERQAGQQRSLDLALEAALSAEDDDAVRTALTQFDQAQLTSESPLVDRARTYLENKERQDRIRAARLALGAAITSADETTARQGVEALRVLLGADEAHDRDIGEAERWLAEKERRRQEPERLKNEADERRTQQSEQDRQTAAGDRSRLDAAERLRREPETGFQIRQTLRANGAAEKQARGRGERGTRAGRERENVEQPQSEAQRASLVNQLKSRLGIGVPIPDIPWQPVVICLAVALGFGTWAMLTYNYRGWVFTPPPSSRPTPRPVSIPTPTLVSSPARWVAGSNAGEARTDPIGGLEYVWIPPGTFQMGCVPGDGQCDGNESPRHTVRFTKGYWLGRTEVTVGAFLRFVQATAYRTISETSHSAHAQSNSAWETIAGSSWRNPGFAQTDSHPVVIVSWDDAVAYCAWAGGRLPTEAEWEYAARGRREGLKYPWGNTITHEDANYSGTDGRDRWRHTSPVGSFEPNGFGLYDMAGNVYQWCRDWFGQDYYKSSAADDPQGPNSGHGHILRAGSWNWTPGVLRTSWRGFLAPFSRGYNIGFRCARDVSP